MPSSGTPGNETAPLRQRGPHRERESEAAPRQRRPSTTAKTVVAAAKQVEAKVETALLILWDELPHWRRDNAFILSGYRQTSNSVRASLASLGYLHNESVNIWTHLLGAAAFTVAMWGNKLDYTGIVFLIVGSYVPALYYGFFCHPYLLTVYLGAIALLGFGCLVVSWFEHFRTPAWRPYRALMFVGLGLSGVVPIIHALTFYEYRELDERMGLSWVVFQGVLYIFGAFLYAVRWPERQFPGTFDIWGSSHQIFHIFVLLAAAAHLYGMTRAFDFHHTKLGVRC
ncbi:ADIPOR-like receptor IZH2 [Madurella mycetomatis]|uniref:ADIPOR-like receptor IZH2 n=1 Tax=Madurella mycetomatis TaxID=100816 RepID=A0A175VZS4_9PEZI|nr:ADIPOR-like receptor IZH2 [Madurella mycetomatis]